MKEGRRSCSNIYVLSSRAVLDDLSAVLRIEAVPVTSVIFRRSLIKLLDLFQNQCYRSRSGVKAEGEIICEFLIVRTPW